MESAGCLFQHCKQPFFGTTLLGCSVFEALSTCQIETLLEPFKLLQSYRQERVFWIVAFILCPEQVAVRRSGRLGCFGGDIVINAVQQLCQIQDSD